MAKTAKDKLIQIITIIADAEIEAGKMDRPERREAAYLAALREIGGVAEGKS